MQMHKNPRSIYILQYKKNIISKFVCTDRFFILERTSLDTSGPMDSHKFWLISSLSLAYKEIYMICIP